MCADRSVRYGWEKSPIDMCAFLLRNLLAIGNDAADLLRVTGGLDLIGMSLGRSARFGRSVSDVGVASGCAGDDGIIAGGLGPGAAGAEIAIDRVMRLVCDDCSGVAVGCDDVICWVGANDRVGVEDDMDGAGGVVGRVVCPVGIG